MHEPINQPSHSTPPQQNQVSLGHPHMYVATYMVNRFCLLKNAGFISGHFGLMDDSGKLLDKFECIFPESVLKDLRENLVTYSAKIGTPKKKTPEWTPKIKDANEDKPGITFSQYGIVDFVHLTNWDDAYAEICFWNYSKASLGDHITQQIKAPFATWGLALLRCDIDMQREFLATLYPA